MSGGPSFFAGFLVFGKIFIFYTYLAVLLAVVVNFWIARIWGRKVVKRLVGDKNMEKIDEFASDYGIKSLIFFRLFQGHLSDFISYAYGLTKIRFVSYFVVSVVAPFPWMLFWWQVLLPRITNFKEFIFWFYLSLIPFLVISGILVVKWKSRRPQPKN